MKEIHMDNNGIHVISSNREMCSFLDIHYARCLTAMPASSLEESRSRLGCYCSPEIALGWDLVLQVFTAHVMWPDGYD